MRAVLRDLGGDQPSFNVVLYVCVTHPDLVARIAKADSWMDIVPNKLCRALTCIWHQARMAGLCVSFTCGLNDIVIKCERCERLHK